MNGQGRLFGAPVTWADLDVWPELAAEWEAEGLTPARMAWAFRLAALPDDVFELMLADVGDEIGDDDFEQSDFNHALARRMDRRDAALALT